MGWQDAPVVEAPTKVVQPPVPQQEGPGYYSRLGSAALKGLVSGGPMGAGLGAMGEMVNTGTKLLDDASYEAGGRVTDMASGAGASPDTAATLGTITNTAIQSVPMVLGGQAVKGVVTPGLQRGAELLMSSALKPTWEQLRTGKAATAINTMLSEGLNVTPGGLTALRTKIGDLNRQIVQSISGSTATVDKVAVASELQKTLAKVARQATPGADMNAVAKAWSEFMNHPLLAGKADIPVQLAQQIKQGTYKSLESKAYGEVGSASTEAQKTLARGLKEQIAKVVPGVESLNAKESKLLAALDIAERRVLMDANKNPMGLAFLASHPMAWAAFLADRSPLFKSLAARIVNSSAEHVAPTAARVGISGATFNPEQQ